MSSALRQTKSTHRLINAYEKQPLYFHQAFLVVILFKKNAGPKKKKKWFVIFQSMHYLFIISPDCVNLISARHGARTWPFYSICFPTPFKNVALRFNIR